MVKLTCMCLGFTMTQNLYCMVSNTWKIYRPILSRANVTNKSKVAGLHD
uniref:Uncharacterized protein n=1 Tax=Arundo donax TaxID=35708 RepID=A0A0A8YNG1_ARUDO